MRRLGRHRLLLGATALAVLTACSAPGNGLIESTGSDPDGLAGTDISDVVDRPALVLQDTAGRPFDLRARADSEITLVFFGYTECPDVCPTTMADLAAARRALPEPVRERVQVVFVSEDPARDTGEEVDAFLARFDPSFLGLVGGGASTAAVITALKAPATEILDRGLPRHEDDDQPEHEHAADAGAVEHTGSVYGFVGDRVVVYTGGTAPPEYAEDLRRLAA